MTLRLLLLAFLTLSCSSPAGDDGLDPIPFGTYFPPLMGDAWEKLTPEQLGWNPSRLTELDAFLESTQTDAFIILYRGRIVHERYFNGTGVQTVHPWFSAGKTVTSTLIGMAEHRGHLFVDDATSKYLGRGWTSLTPAVENRITIKHQLTMTTGLDDYPNGQTDLGNCLQPECLVYKAEPGTRWAYHNAPYRLLIDVLESALGKPRNQITQEWIGDVIGIQRGSWFLNGYIYASTAREAARFGLFISNGAKWGNGPQLLGPIFLRDMVKPNQTPNASYGYLWWLNGQSSHMLPGTQIVYQGALVPTAPSDMVAALGMDDQKIYIVPSRELVVVRFGDRGGSANPLALSQYDRDLWARLMAVMGG